MRCCGRAATPDVIPVSARRASAEPQGPWPTVDPRAARRPGVGTPSVGKAESPTSRTTKAFRSHLLFRAIIAGLEPVPGIAWGLFANDEGAHCRGEGG